MLLYISVFVGLILFAVFYSKIAKICNIVDVPNERSSHTFPVIRGGGILFFCAVIIFFFISDYQYPNFLIGLTILSILSFTDDIYTLKARIRLPFQFLAIFFILNAFHIEILPMWGIIIAVIIAVAFINIYNFMDGINGITGLYSLAVLQGFWILNKYLIPVVNEDLLIFSGLALFVFGFFNFRKKAKFFAGDIGSISLAGIILFVGIKFLVVTQSPLILGLVAIYAIDAGFTILRRILNGENIFHAHRQHLYQELVHRKNFSHIKVAAGYALVQLFINLIIYYSFSLDLTIQYFISIIVFSIMSIVYLILFSWTRRSIIETPDPIPTNTSKIKTSFLGKIQDKLTAFNLGNINYLPRQVVLLIDIFLLSMALAITHFAFRAIDISFFSVLPKTVGIAILLGVNILFFFVIKTYSGLIRHSSFTDILKLSFSSVATIFTLGLIQYSYYFSTGDKIFVLVGVLLYTVLSFTFLLTFRVFVKQLYQTFKLDTKTTDKKRIAILGADDNSIALGHALTTTSGQPFYLVAYLSEKPLKKIKIGGKPVISVTTSLERVLPSLNLDGLLIIGEKLSLQKKNELVNICLTNKIQVYNAPQVEEWNLNSDFSKNIKTVEIEDLLDRESIHLNDRAIKEDLYNKNILITGAAGSIGSELVRQIAVFKPKKLVLVDQAETPLYALELELKESFPDLAFKVVLATISNKYRMEALFSKHNFSSVFHAAAYKHVPIIERNPREAIMVNLLGTIILAKLSSQYEVNKFVMISTDKAVNPTNVMGASKRAAEMYVQSFQQNQENRTQFITTRFGNVLGSNGSVIPHFKDQISKGGPVTVTHPDIIRYFMTIPEACQLVLEAGTMGKGGEILVFDMGKPVRILDLAIRMIKLSGFQPYVDIDIEITGLRPGEKLYEELLSETTKTLPTHHKKILISKDVSSSFEEIKAKTEKLIKSSIRASDKKEMVKLLKELVPEFISKNSDFEELDIKEDALLLEL